MKSRIVFYSCLPACLVSDRLVNSLGRQVRAVPKIKISNYILLVSIFLLSVSPIWSQEGRLPLSSNSLLLNSSPTPPISLNTSFLVFHLNTTKPSIFPNLSRSMAGSTLNKQPSTYCAADLAFFCRLEVQMEKATKIPVRFRLGDVQQVDYLEGKHEGWRYGY